MGIQRGEPTSSWRKQDLGRGGFLPCEDGGRGQRESRCLEVKP